MLRQAHDGALLPKLEQQVNPLTIAHEQVLHAVSDVCFDLLTERGLTREQVVVFFQQLDTAAREAEGADGE
jgi:hypothetical protein